MLSWLIVLLLQAPAQASAQPCAKTVELKTGAGCFQFVDVAAKSPLDVHYFKPKATGPTTRILFSLHGMSRTAKSHRDIWIQEATKRAVLVLAPEFSKGNFPSEMSYTLGNMGQPAANADEKLWGFSVIERLFDAVKAKEANTRQTYALFGHSAGAQFVQRMILFKPKARISGAVAANAGFYAQPDLAVSYPNGVGKSGVTKASLAESLKLPLTVLLGDEDDDPNDAKLAKGKAAAAQGANRVERGKAYIEAGKAKAQELKVPYAWKLKMVPGVAHNPAGCVKDAAAILLP